MRGWIRMGGRDARPHGRLALALLLASTACMPDDYDGTGWPPAADTDVVADTDATDTDVPSDAPAIVGTWLSEGADLSDLFAGEPFNYVEVQAVFRANGRSEVHATDTDGATYDITGTYTVDAATDPATITVQQTSPYEATAEGIWSVAGDTLTYEVVQTVPDYGFAPPTPSSGFGTTSGPNLEPGTNVQTYRRAP